MMIDIAENELNIPKVCTRSIEHFKEERKETMTYS